MSSNELIILASGKSIGRKNFVVGEISVGKFIDPKNLKVVSESDSKEEMEKFISSAYPNYSKNSVLTAIEAGIFGIWSK